MTTFQAMWKAPSEPETASGTSVVSSASKPLERAALAPFRAALRVEEPEPTGVIRGSVQEDLGIDPESERRVAWQRRVARMLAGDVKLPLAILSFVGEGGPVDVSALTAQGEPRAVFEAVFDLYDADLLTRDGATVSITDSGRFLLRRAGVA